MDYRDWLQVEDNQREIMSKIESDLWGALSANISTTWSSLLRTSLEALWSWVSPTPLRRIRSQGSTIPTLKQGSSCLGSPYLRSVAFSMALREWNSVNKRKLPTKLSFIKPTLVDNLPRLEGRASSEEKAVDFNEFQELEWTMKN